LANGAEPVFGCVLVTATFEATEPLLGLLPAVACALLAFSVAEWCVGVPLFTLGGDRPRDILAAIVPQFLRYLPFQTMYVSLGIAALRHDMALVVGLFGPLLMAVASMRVGQDLAVEQHHRAAADRSARTDALTGLGNRMQLTEVARDVIEESRLNGQDVALLVGDLDNFKQCNDRYGHNVGDDVLIRTAEAVSASAGVTASSIARYGGEEFVVLVAGAARRDVAALAEQIRVAVGEEVGRFDVTISVGVAFLEDLDEFGDLFARADRAMYSAKASGKNCVVVFGDFMWRISERLRGITDLVRDQQPRRALAELDAVYDYLVEHGLDKWRSQVSSARAEVHTILGDLPTADRYAQTAMVEARGEDAALLARAAATAALVMANRGVVDEGFDRALALASADQSRGGVWARSIVALARASAAAYSGDVVVARSIVQLVEFERTDELVTVALWQLRTGIRCGDDSAPDTAKRVLEDVREQSPLVETARDEIDATVEGIRSGSIQGLLEIADRWQKCGRLLDAYRTKTSAAVLSADRIVARELLMAVRSGYEACGAAPDAAIASALLEAIRRDDSLDVAA
jgi:diguanylate cyclase (GGDEF)-like protein